MVEFRTKLDSSKTTALNNNTFKRAWWAFALLSAVFVVIGIFGLLFREDESDFMFAVTCIVIGVCFTPLCYVLTRILQKRINKSTSFISDNTVEVYTFDEDKITITQTKGDEFSSVIQAKYSYLYKVLENKDYYFLYVSRMQCHIIDKASITQGDLNEMNELLIMRLGDRFKRK